MEVEPEESKEAEESVEPLFISGMRLGGIVRLITMTKDKLTKTQLKEVCSYFKKPNHCMYQCLDWLKNLDFGLDKPKNHLPTTIKVTTATIEPCKVCGDEDHTKAKCRAIGYSLDVESDKEELPKENTMIRAMRVGKEIVDMEVYSFCKNPGH
ncbi:hypothetical protein RUND412_011518, partial [Rhizina undulata]